MTLALEILVPEPEVVATSELKVDGKNPNKMSREQHDRLKASIKKFGFIVPIITNKDLLIADGEQRWIIAKEFAILNPLTFYLYWCRGWDLNPHQSGDITRAPLFYYAFAAISNSLCNIASLEAPLVSFCK